MGLLSKLFGRNKEDKALQDALALVKKIIDDEKYQLEIIDPNLRSMLESRPAFDKDPNGTGPFGFSATNPIPVNGPIGQLAYLSRLETQSGQRILFHRLGAIAPVDVFEAVTFNGNEWFILFLDLYHPRCTRLTPDGFNFTKQCPQFSGFSNYCENFPYDFVEGKESERASGLSIAYIPIGKVSEQIHRQLFNRPPEHIARVNKIKNSLKSLQKQY